MGDLVGNIIGGVGSLLGSNQAAKKEDEAAQSALTGFNYLSTNPLISGVQSNATAAQGGQNAALGGMNQALGAQGQALAGQAATQGDIRQLLLSNGADNPAFKNYLNSTGYNFQLKQGTDAITGSAAAKGLLNSGATAKALQGYGQGLAGNYFNQYVDQLGGLAGAQGNLAQGYGALGSGTNSLAGAYGGIVGQGLNAAEAVGQAGTTGGNNAGNYQAKAGESEGTGISQAFNYFGGAAQSSLPSAAKFFG